MPSQESDDMSCSDSESSKEDDLQKLNDPNKVNDLNDHKNKSKVINAKKTKAR